MPKSVNKIRCSSLDRFFACASSVKKPTAPHEPESPQALFGDYVHACIAAAVRGRPRPAPTTGIDTEEADRLIATGITVVNQMRDELNPKIPPQTELKVQTSLIEGTLDLAYEFDDACVVYDWKAGRHEGDHTNQICGYLEGYMHARPSIKRGIGIVVWLRTGHIDRIEMSREDLDQWREGFSAQYTAIGKHYAAGSHCHFCPRRVECKTVREYSQNAVKSLVSIGKAELTREKVGEIWHQYERAKATVIGFEVFAKELLKSGGPLKLPDGRTAEMIEASRSSLDPVKTIGVLNELGFMEDEIQEKVTISIKAAKELVRASAQEGSKQVAEDQLMQALSMARAITKKTHLELSVD
jgi:hypothetical protein